MSYPDFVEQDGRIWVSATQKTVARVHEIDPALLQAVWETAWTAPGAGAPATADLLCDLDLRGRKSAATPAAELPQLPLLSNGGLTIEVWLSVAGARPGATVLSTYGSRNRGLHLTLAADDALRLEIHDGVVRSWYEVEEATGGGTTLREAKRWSVTTDSGGIAPGKEYHVAFILDGRARIAGAVVDGRLCDGGDRLIQGWKRMHPYIDDINGENLLRLGGAGVTLARVRLHGKTLRTAEVR
jgi:hypothetical protein